MANDWTDLDEINRYEQALQAYRALQMEPGRFMGLRLQMGVYGQRQEGLQMVRIKVPGGRLRAQQLAAVADVLERHSRHDVAHVTTRQDIQLHHVPLERTPAVLRQLAAAGLSTREACGNTVRNVTACPLAGVCPRERVDVAPFLEATVRQFLRHPLTQYLPRKFKISFSGCEADCAQGLMHDLGIVAMRQDGRFGFKILAGGGLGHKPHAAITVEPFVEAQDLLACVEAVLALHHRHSDRSKRARSRIKFLVDRFGPQGFIEKYREELQRTRAFYAGRPYPQGEWSVGREAPICGSGAPRTPLAQKQAGLYVVPVSLPLGDITAGQLRGLAAWAQEAGLEEIRSTQDQNLMLVNVPAERVAALHARLRDLGLGEPTPGDNVVACPGTSTCRLGITSSKGLGAALSGGSADLRIRVSGCQNGCAQPELADIGMYGVGKRLHGRLVPHYRIFLAGDGRAGGALGVEGPEVPAARMPAAVERIRAVHTTSRQADESFFAWVRRQPAGFFEALLADLVQVVPENLPALMREPGGAADFRVEQFGGGECAGAAEELVAACFAEAAYEQLYRDAYLARHAVDQALDCAQAMLRLVARALLVLSAAQNKQELEEIAPALASALASSSPLRAGFEYLLSRLAHLQEFLSESELLAFMRELDGWIQAVAEHGRASDRHLALGGPTQVVQAQSIDLSSYPCPMNYLKARLLLEQAAPLAILHFDFDNALAAHHVASSLTEKGYGVVSQLRRGEHVSLAVRKFV